MTSQNNKDFSNNFFAEVIDSKISNFVAQSWEWNFFPEFGSLVQVETKDCTILGIVTQIQTGSMDPLRYPFAYKKTEAELLNEQPQIFEFLKTTFNVQITGYIKQNKIYYLLPQKPCSIHTFVSKASENIFVNFFKNPDFLHLLFSFASQINNIDELLLAILHQLKEKNLLKENKLEDFCRNFSLLTGNDYRRLKLFLKRVQSI